MILHTIVDPMEVMMQPQSDSLQYRRINGLPLRMQRAGDPV